MKLSKAKKSTKKLTIEATNNIKKEIRKRNINILL